MTQGYEDEQERLKAAVEMLEEWVENEEEMDESMDSFLITVQITATYVPSVRDTDAATVSARYSLDGCGACQNFKIVSDRSFANAEFFYQLVQRCFLLQRR